MRYVARLRESDSSMDQSNLDPFLDIVSNVFGVLIVVAVLIGVSVTAATTTVRAPQIYEAPKSLEWKTLYCLDGRVAPSEPETFTTKLEEFAKLQFGNRWQWTYECLVQVWQHWKKNSETFCDENFGIVNFDWDENSRTASFYLSLLENNSADNLQSLRSGKSKFEAWLKELEPNEHGLLMVVSPASFQEFQQARDIAKAAGFHVSVLIRDSEKTSVVMYAEGEGSTFNPIPQ